MKPLNLALGLILAFTATLSLAQAADKPKDSDVSSLLFTASLALIQVDSNVTNYDLQHGYGQEANALASPYASGDKRIIYDTLAMGACVGVREALRPLGLQDLPTAVIAFAEIKSISTWNPGPDDIGREVALCEAEYLVTSSVLNIRF